MNQVKYHEITNFYFFFTKKQTSIFCLAAHTLAVHDYVINFFWYTAIFVWFSQFIMRVVQNYASLSKNDGLGQAHPKNSWQSKC